MHMLWKTWRDDREGWRAHALGVPRAELPAEPLRVMGWYLDWLASSLPDSTLYQFLRMLEVPAIIIALVAFWFDFIVDRPADRIIRAWTVIAQSPNAGGNIGQTAALTALAKAGQDIGGVNLTGAWLVGANLRGFMLDGANLTRADLTDADLMEANLTGANLTDADLTAADLMEADLYGADLTGANLTNADLMEARLSDANLTGANLTNADLTDAYLSGARYLTQDQLDSACISKGGTPSSLLESEGLKPLQQVCELLTR